jgi:hypothetical protein
MTKMSGSKKNTKHGFNNWHMDELKESWDDNTRTLIHKRCP